jgi:hypothetical protein
MILYHYIMLMVLGGFVPSSVNAYFFLYILVFYKYYQIWWLVISEMTMVNLTAWSSAILRGLNVIIFFPYTSLLLERQKRSKIDYIFFYIYNCLVVNILFNQACLILSMSKFYFMVLLFVSATY